MQIMIAIVHAMMRTVVRSSTTPTAPPKPDLDTTGSRSDAGLEPTHGDHRYPCVNYLQAGPKPLDVIWASPIKIFERGGPARVFRRTEGRAACFHPTSALASTPKPKDIHVFVHRTDIACRLSNLR
jgi:hypothetical protein